jgi:phosphatidylserine decarboxylase
MNICLYAFMALLPKNLVSRLFGAFTRLRIPLLSALARTWFARHYQLNMEEAEQPLSAYPNIHSLFIRKLKPDARPVAEGVEIVSPVDGVLSQTGVLDYGAMEMIQAKGKSYSLSSLLRDDALAKQFAGGCWATIYLAPFNYHRIHSPVAGELVSAHYCPGNLWPVNGGSVQRIEGLFAINERLITRIRVHEGGEILVVKVGATNVGRITVSYTDELVTNAKESPDRRVMRTDWFPQTSSAFSLAQEIGRFEMGSTVILVCNKIMRDRNPGVFALHMGQPVRVGQAL